eukprot:TRINITY_DN1436_c0_g1_i3.p1 TRINITY_DN1436_c0_g1~~TRINITY_DN1436_c0_g1_i3.p1  ORF type:complete len:388 (-),score=105.50 TRINITY_DN1436_c0_g1_i3:149-1312(-)
MLRSILLIFLVSLTFALDNGLGRTPPMGFNTWNHFYCNIDEKIIKNSADFLVSLGLKDLGYNYVNIDDCWMANARVDGKLVANATRFPSGIKALAKYCHDKGLKLGIYSSAGTKTCQKLPASLGYEDVDAATWASWDIDYLKYDNCFRDSQSALARYSKMRDALNKTGRPMFYSICNWGQEEVWKWGKDVGNSWRTTGDIEDRFESMRKIYMRNVILGDYGKPGGWNDPDMLEVGNGKMNTIEYRTHFTLWAMAKSPLLIGCDLTKIKKVDLDILKNKAIIALNQDKTGDQARCKMACREQDFRRTARRAQIAVMKTVDGYALAITNWNDRQIIYGTRVVFSELGLDGSSYKAVELWTKQELGVVKDSFIHRALVPHGTAVYRLTKV